MTLRSDFEDKFAKTGKNIDDMVNNTSENMREERRKLKSDWTHLETKMKDTGEDAWDGVKDEMERGRDKIEESYNDLKNNVSEHGDHTGHNH